MSNDKKDEQVDDEQAIERVLGPGAKGDVDEPAVAPAGSMPLAPVGDDGVADEAVDEVPEHTPLAAPATPEGGHQ